MTLFIFTKKILAGEAIYNNGNMWRDFTYIDDIVKGVLRISDFIPIHNDSWTVKNGNPSTSSAPYSVYNINYGNPII